MVEMCCYCGDPGLKIKVVKLVGQDFEWKKKTKRQEMGGAAQAEFRGYIKTTEKYQS